MRKLKENPDFSPCTPAIGDEVLGCYPFKWNITKISTWIDEHLSEVELSTVQVNPPSMGADSENLDEEFIPKANLTRPVIIVRMRPEFFRLIDGNHRVAKERHLGVKELPAYYLTNCSTGSFSHLKRQTGCMKIIGMTSWKCLRKTVGNGALLGISVYKKIKGKRSSHSGWHYITKNAQVPKGEKVPPTE